MILLLVNDLNESGGYTNRLNLFVHNLNKIGDNYYKEFKEELEQSPKEQLVKFAILGRYIGIIEMKKDWSTGSMVFMDFKKNDNFAKSFFTTLIVKYKEEELADSFFWAYYESKKHYDEDYNYVRLELDSSEFN